MTLEQRAGGKDRALGQYLVEVGTSVFSAETTDVLNEMMLPGGAITVAGRKLVAPFFQAGEVTPSSLADAMAYLREHLNIIRVDEDPTGHHSDSKLVWQDRRLPGGKVFTTTLDSIEATAA